LSIIDDLITDRTRADVDNRTAKGSYCAEDLNRVGEAMRYVAGCLRSAGYAVNVRPRVDWTDEEWGSPAEVLQLLTDLQALRSAFALMADTPDVPVDLAGLTYTKANDIEKILQTVDNLLTNIVAARFCSGDLYSGEV